jgi:hypothetical protein
MEPQPKIKLPVPYKQIKQTSDSLKKISTKLNSLNKTGTKKILHFAGSNEVEAMFYLYLFKKYKSNCFLHDKNLRRRILGMSILISEKYEPQQVEEIQDQLDNLSKILVDCISNLDTKIIIIPVQLLFAVGAHANVLIYRKNLNQIEHFEPHGRKFSSDEDDVDNKIIEKWMKIFILKINARLQLIRQPQVKLIESSEVCPYIDGLQNLEGWSNLAVIAGVEPPGYCTAWSMFFTEICLKNPDVPSSVLINYVFKFLDSMTNPEKMDYLKSVIRGYSVFINEKINKYFSVFFKSGLTIQKIKNFSRSELSSFKNILRHLIDLEMNLETDPLYLKTTLGRIKTELTHLNESLKLNSSDDAIKKEIKMLSSQKKVFEIYNDFVKFSNPTDSVSYSSARSKSCPPGKEINPKTGRCIKTKTKKVKTKLEKGKVAKVKVVKAGPNVEPGLVPEPVSKSCPPGKEINPRTGRCIKTKTQKVKKVKIPKMKTSKQKVVIKLEPEPVKELVKQVAKSCPPGKEINPKTGRCVKTKTQKVKKVKKVKIPKVKVAKAGPNVEPIICPEGCVKTETETKKDEKINKICPEGKELNLKTGRCVKVKTRKQKIKE